MRLNKLSILLFVFTQFTPHLVINNKTLRGAGFTYYACLAQEQGQPKENIDTEKAKQTIASDNPSEVKQYLFHGEVKEDNINIRSDSTTSAEIICKVNKNEPLDVLSELYGWYKVRLPPNAPSFIKKEFVALDEEKTAKVSKDNVNIRLRPDISSPILGKLSQDEPVNILKDFGEWYRIEPVKNSFGWILSNFVKKIEKKKIKLAAEKKNETTQGQITFEGIIKPKTVTHLATHKLTTEDNKLYLLKSSKENLDSFNNRKVKIIGKLVDPSRKNPIIEVEKIEALN